MDHSEVKHFPKVDHTPADLTKLSDAIRVGHFMIGEQRLLYLADGCGCALGAALATQGYKSQNDKDLNGGFSVVSFISKRFNVPTETVHQISERHFSRQMNRLEIADWLESQGF